MEAHDREAKWHMSGARKSRGDTALKQIHLAGKGKLGTGWPQPSPPKARNNERLN